MEPLSDAQYQAAVHGGMPEPERIGEGLWSLPMEMPGDFLAYSLSVVRVGEDGAVTIVDPGWRSDSGLDRIAGFLGEIGVSLEDVRSIVVTHAHPDHLGLADLLRERSGAALLLGRREQEAREAASVPHPDEARERLLGWG